MFKRRYVTLLPLFVLLAACSSKPKPTETETTTGTPSGGFLLDLSVTKRGKDAD